jgi:hypothetical protein
MHFLELPKLRREDATDPAQTWGRFFLVRDEQELQELAMTSPAMKQAGEALWWVSQDPESQQLAEMRERAERVHRHTMAAERDDGRIDGLRHAVRTAATALGIDLDSERAFQIETMHTEQLAELVQRLVKDRRWPD